MRPLREICSYAYVFLSQILYYTPATARLDWGARERVHAGGAEPDPERSAEPEAVLGALSGESISTWSTRLLCLRPLPCSY